MKGKVIIVGNQKGGVGKSTITGMLANHLHSIGKKVVVFDADDLQTSLTKIRERECETNGIDSSDIYPLVQTNSTDVPDIVDKMKGVYDYILVDLPGNLKQQGVIQCYFKSDVVIVPLEASVLDMDSTKDFVKFLLDVVKPYKDKENMPIKIMGLINKVKPNTLEVKEMMDMQNIYGIKLLSNYIKDSVNVKRSVSTIENINENIMVLDEICENIN